MMVIATLIVLVILLAAAYILFTGMKFKPNYEGDDPFIIPRVFGWIPAGLAITIWIWCCVVIVPTGFVGILQVFGVKDLQHTIAESSLGLKWPWQSVKLVNVQVINLDFTGESHIAGNSSDGAQVTLDVTVPIRLNQTAAPFVSAKIRGEWDEYLASFIRSGLRDAVAKTTWRDALNGNREALASHIRETVQQKIYTNLVENGFSPAMARNAFVISEPQIKGVVVPPRIANALNDNNAAIIEQETAQARLVVAQRQVAIREQEGRGYSSLLTSLPPGVTPSQAANMMNAFADIKNAESLAAAIETPGSVGSLTVILGNASPAVSTGGPAAPR